MDVDIIQSNDKVFEFTLSGVSTTFANAIRRTAINSVKCFAIDSVTVYENSSALFDEYIAHRIGLIPLATPDKIIDSDEILFTLDATGPGTVYSKDLKSTDENIKVAIDNIPIMKLGEKEKLRLDGKAIVGSALKHVKFQPGLVTYEQINDNSFKFYVEAFGQMSSKAIISKSLDILSEEIKELSKVAK